MGVSREASWALGIWPVPGDQRTFWDLWLEFQAFNIIARAAHLHINWWLLACGLAIKARFLWRTLWSLTHGVDAWPGTFPTGTPDCCSRDFLAFFGSGWSSLKLVMYALLSLYVSLALPNWLCKFSQVDDIAYSLNLLLNVLSK